MDRSQAWRVFVAVAEAGSFVGAARRLGRSPAAVTRAISALEERLATRLFNRTTRSVALSDAGARFLEPCTRILSELDALEASASGPVGEPRGALAVTSSVLFGRLHVAPIAREFADRHGGVDVRLLLVDRVVPLVEEGIDVGVRLGDLPDSSLRATRVGSVRRAVYASPAYLARHGTPAHPRDLRDHLCVAVSTLAPNPERWSFEAAGRALPVSIRPRLTVNVADAAIDAAVAGFGVARVLSYMVRHHVDAGALVAVLEDFEPPPVPIHVVHPAGRFVPPQVRAFVDLAVDALRTKFGSTRP